TSMKAGQFMLDRHRKTPHANCEAVASDYDSVGTAGRILRMLQAGGWIAVPDGSDGRCGGGRIRNRHCDHSARGTRIQSEVYMKALIVLALLAIVASLGKALFSMSSGPEHAAGVVRALTWRIGLSLALFVTLLLGYYFGLITPNTMH